MVTVTLIYQITFVSKVSVQKLQSIFQDLTSSFREWMLLIV